MDERDRRSLEARQLRNLRAILEDQGHAAQVAAERAAEWQAEALRQGIDPSPDYVRHGLRWLAERHPRREG